METNKKSSKAVKYAAIYARTFANETYPYSIEEQIRYCKFVAIKNWYRVPESFIFVDENFGKNTVSKSKVQGMLKMNEVVFNIKEDQDIKKVEAIFCLSLDRIICDWAEYMLYGVGSLFTDVIVYPIIKPDLEVEK